MNTAHSSPVGLLTLGSPPHSEEKPDSSLEALLLCFGEDGKTASLQGLSSDRVDQANQNLVMSFSRREGLVTLKVQT